MVEKVERKRQLREKRRVVCMSCKEDKAAYKRLSYLKRKESGLCTKCGKELGEYIVGTTCMPCRDRQSVYYRRYYLKHREKMLQRALKRKESGRCPSCGRMLDKDIDGDNVTCAICIEASGFRKRMHSGGCYLRY